MNCFAHAKCLAALVVCSCVLLMRSAPAHGNIVYISQTRSVSVEGTVTPNDHAPVTQSSSRSATGFGSFSASLDADPVYQSPSVPDETLSATVHADVTSQLLANQIIAKGHLSVYGSIGLDQNGQDFGTIAATGASQFRVTFRTTQLQQYALFFDAVRVGDFTVPLLADAKGRSVLGTPKQDGEPFESTYNWDGSLPAGVYTLTAPQAVAFAEDQTRLINSTLKLTLSPRAIPLPTALLSGGPTLLGLALFVRLRKRHAGPG